MEYKIGLTLTTLNTQINKPLSKTNKKIDMSLKSHLRTLINSFHTPIICFYVKERTKRGLEHLHVHLYSNIPIYKKLRKIYNTSAISGTNIEYLKKTHKNGFNVSYIKGVQKEKKLYYMSNGKVKYSELMKLKKKVLESFNQAKKYKGKYNLKITRPAKIKIIGKTIFLSRTINKIQVRTQKKLENIKNIYPILNQTSRYYNKKISSIKKSFELKKLQKKVIEYIERLSNQLCYCLDIKNVIIFMYNFFKEVKEKESKVLFVKKYPT